MMQKLGGFSLFVCVSLWRILSVHGEIIVDDEIYTEEDDILIQGRCHAHCYKKFGFLPDHVNEDGYYKITDEFCPNSQCKECLSPCANATVSYEDCIEECGVSEACYDSCSHILESILDGVDDVDDLDTSEVTEISRPFVRCYNQRQNFKCRPGSVYLYVTWSILTQQTQDTTVYVIETRQSSSTGQETDWKIVRIEPSTLVKVDGLSCDTLYQFRVTPVSARGKMGYSVISDWTRTYTEQMKLKRPVSLKVVDVKIVNQDPYVTVGWDPGKNASCSVKMYWLDPGLAVVTSVEIKTPWKYQYNITNLDYELNYTIYIGSADDDMKTSDDVTTINYVTPDCLPSTMFNHTKCPPLKPRNLTASVLTSNFNSPHVKYINVSLSWLPPLGTRNGQDIQRYMLYYRKAPPANAARQIKPHNSNIVLEIPKTKTSYFIHELHNHNMYVFYLKAISEGGPGNYAQIKNYFGLTSYTNETEAIIVRREENADLGIAEIVAIILIPLLLLLAVPIAIVLCRKRKRRHLKRNYLSTRQSGPVEEMNPIYEGMSVFRDSGTVKQIPDSFEIDYSCLDFISLIGEGAFGKVVKAEFYQSPDDRGRKAGKIVAVKMLKDFYTGDESRNFLLEIQSMKNLGQHPCILGIIGSCLTGPKLCLIMDYCALGDLRNYLRKYRERILYNMPATYGMMTKADRNFQENLLNSDGGGSLSTDTTDTQDDHDGSEITEAQLLSYARQITMGMEFLEQKKFIHRDLAARNILLFDKRHIKISDFGLTRYVYETNVYQPTSARKLPYKWMAIESLFSQRFTIKSDVWSFGIVLWEIVTLGGSPYPSIPLQNLYGLLNDGYRMERPENCSKQVYQIMLSCWHPNPHCRPAFGQLRGEIDKLLEETQSYIDLSVEVSGDYFNESTQNSKPEDQSADLDNTDDNTIQLEDLKSRLVVDIHNEPKLEKICFSGLKQTDEAENRLLPSPYSVDKDNNTKDIGLCSVLNSDNNCRTVFDDLDKTNLSHSNCSLYSPVYRDHHLKHSFRRSIKAIIEKVGIRSLVHSPKTIRRSRSLNEGSLIPGMHSQKDAGLSVTAL